MGDDASRMVKHFFEYAFLLKELNKTFITLIPKIDSLKIFKEFRPINLCNIAYKAISKVMVLRLQELMKEIISPNQHAFVKGRLISDNTFLAAKMMNFIHGAKNKKSFWCALKIDFHNAYDRVNWDFLEATLMKMNFSEHITKIIMQCVRTVQYMVLLNGHKVDKVFLKRVLDKRPPVTLLIYNMYECALCHITQS